MPRCLVVGAFDTTRLLEHVAPIRHGAVKTLSAADRRRLLRAAAALGRPFVHDGMHESQLSLGQLRTEQVVVPTQQPQPPLRRAEPRKGLRAARARAPLKSLLASTPHGDPLEQTRLAQALRGEPRRAKGRLHLRGELARRREDEQRRRRHGLLQQPSAPCHAKGVHLDDACMRGAERHRGAVKRRGSEEVAKRWETDGPSVASHGVVGCEPCQPRA